MIDVLNTKLLMFFLLNKQIGSEILVNKPSMQSKMIKNFKKSILIHWACLPTVQLGHSATISPSKHVWRPKQMCRPKKWGQHPSTILKTKITNIMNLVFVLLLQSLWSMGWSSLTVIRMMVIVMLKYLFPFSWSFPYFSSMAAQTQLQNKCHFITLDKSPNNRSRM